MRRAKKPLPPWVQDKVRGAVPWGEDKALDAYRRECAEAARRTCAIWRRTGMDPYKGFGAQVNG